MHVGHAHRVWCTVWAAILSLDPVIRSTMPRGLGVESVQRARKGEISNPSAKRRKIVRSTSKPPLAEQTADVRNCMSLERIGMLA